MNQDLMKNRELISALADGQLRGAEFARTVELTAVDDDARSSWQVYHMVGDVLRSQDLASGAPDAAFMARLSNRLASEIVGAATSLAAVVPAAIANGVGKDRAVAANDGGMRWKLVAGFASITAVAAIGWGTLANTGALPSQPQLAQAVMVSPSSRLDATQPAQQVTVAGTQQVMIRDARLDELMSAHRQFDGMSALQMPAGFLRNATFEGSAR